MKLMEKLFKQNDASNQRGRGLVWSMTGAWGRTNFDTSQFASNGGSNPPGPIAVTF